MSALFIRPPHCSELLIATSRLSEIDLALLDDEQTLLVGCTPVRRREIAAGRTLGHAALVQLGFPKAPIMAGPLGEPLWPEGICGSISHTLTRVAVVVASTRVVWSVGIDLDDGRPLGDDLERKVLSPAERIEVFAASPGFCGNAANLAFSAKESFFKCQYPLVRIADLDFDDLELQRSSVPNSLECRWRTTDDQLLKVARMTRIFVDLRSQAPLCWAVAQKNTD
jgi:4'-phosphopantetheinyl transferase EntD